MESIVLRESDASRHLLVAFAHPDDEEGRELYDLGADPGERHDITEEQRKAADELLPWLRRYTGESTTTRPEQVEVSPETETQLRALGYLD